MFSMFIIYTIYNARRACRWMAGVSYLVPGLSDMCLCSSHSDMEPLIYAIAWRISRRRSRVFGRSRLFKIP